MENMPVIDFFSEVDVKVVSERVLRLLENPFIFPAVVLRPSSGWRPALLSSTAVTAF